MLEINFKCVVCNHKQNKILSYKNFDYFKCINCGLVSTYPLPSKKEIKNHYKKEFNKGNYKFLRLYSKQYQKVYSGFLSEIEKYLINEGKSLNKLKILDIGCFTGDFLLLASIEGADVWGIELQKEAVRIADKKLPGRIKEKNISDNPFKKQKFDIITMFGLIEHIENPQKTIHEIKNMLKKDGILVIQTPNIDSVLAKLLQKYWPPYTPVEHIHLFGKKSINKILNNNDLQIKFSKNHYKVLPIAYVYNMLTVFGPEIKKIISKIEIIYDIKKSKISLPFYIGEMFIIAIKKQ